MLFLSQQEVADLLDLDNLLTGLENGFRELSAGRASVPPRIAARAPSGLLGAMPGFVDGVLASKLVSVFPANHASGLPSHQALIVLFDHRTGSPLAVMDGTHITAARTGAAAAVSTKALGRMDARVLAVLGAGVQGRSHIDSHARVRDFREIRVASRTFDNARRLASAVGATASASFEEATDGADVICFCTDAAVPFSRRQWFRPGAHITSVGGSAEGPELDAETVAMADILAVEHRGAFGQYPAGAHELQGVDAGRGVELGEILSGTHPGRTSDEQVTLYKSTGHAVEDAVAAGMVYEAALAAGAGTTVQL